MHLPSLRLASAALALGLAAASPASAAVVADLESTFSLKLTLTTSFYVGAKSVAGGQVEEQAKLATIRLTQRDLLESLIEDDEIAGPLSGWSLVARTTSDDAEDVDYSLFAVKRGQPDYPLDEEDTEALDLEVGPMPMGYKVRYLGDTPTSGSGTVLGSFSGVFESDGETLNLGGIVRAPFSYKKTPFDDGTAVVLVPGKVTLNVLGGADLYDSELGYLPTVIQGSFAFAPHKITAVRETAPAQ